MAVRPLQQIQHILAFTPNTVNMHQAETRSAKHKGSTTNGQTCAVEPMPSYTDVYYFCYNMHNPLSSTPKEPHPTQMVQHTSLELQVAAPLTSGLEPGQD